MRSLAHLDLRRWPIAAPVAAAPPARRGSACRGAPVARLEHADRPGNDAWRPQNASNSISVVVRTRMPQLDPPGVPWLAIRYINRQDLATIPLILLQYVFSGRRAPMPKIFDCFFSQISFKVMIVPVATCRHKSERHYPFS
jgi:hypothetical protein